MQVRLKWYWDLEIMEPRADVEYLESSPARKVIKKARKLEPGYEFLEGRAEADGLRIWNRMKKLEPRLIRATSRAQITKREGERRYSYRQRRIRHRNLTARSISSTMNLIQLRDRTPKMQATVKAEAQGPQFEKWEQAESNTGNLSYGIRSMVPGKYC